VQHIDGVDFLAACRTLGAEDRPATPRPVSRPQSSANDNNSARAGELWRSAVPITGTLAEVYLRSRGLDFLDCEGGY
jgi:hypothetical protein